MMFGIRSFKRLNWLDKKNLEFFTQTDLQGHVDYIISTESAVHEVAYTRPM